MITITINQQTFEIENFIALEQVIRKNRALEEKILSETFKTTTHFKQLICSSFDLVCLKILAPEFVQSLYPTIVSDPSLLDIFVKDLIELTQFVSAFPNEKNNIYEQITTKSDKLYHLFKTTNVLGYHVKCINEIFPDQHQTTLAVLLADKELVKPLIKSELGYIGKTRIETFIATFPNQRNKIYDYLTQNFVSTLNDIVAIMETFPEQERNLYEQFLSDSTLFSKFVDTEEDFSMLEQASHKLQLLFHFCHTTTQSINNKNLNDIFKIAHFFSSLKESQHYFKFVPLLINFIENTVGKLKNKNIEDFEYLQEALIFLKATLTHYKEKDNLTNLCIEFIQKNGFFKETENNANFNLSSLPQDLQIKLNPAPLQNAPEQSNYTYNSISKSG